MVSRSNTRSLVILNKFLTRTYISSTIIFPFTNLIGASMKTVNSIPLGLTVDQARQGAKNSGLGVDTYWRLHVAEKIKTLTPPQRARIRSIAEEVSVNIIPHPTVRTLIPALLANPYDLDTQTGSGPIPWNALTLEYGVSRQYIAKRVVAALERHIRKETARNPSFKLPHPIHRYLAVLIPSKLDTGARNDTTLQDMIDSGEYPYTLGNYQPSDKEKVRRINKLERLQHAQMRIARRRNVLSKAAILSNLNDELQSRVRTIQTHLQQFSAANPGQPISLRALARLIADHVMIGFPRTKKSGYSVTKMPSPANTLAFAKRYLNTPSNPAKFPAISITSLETEAAAFATS